MECGGGTYIRSIARECGEALIVPPEHTDVSYDLCNPAGAFCAGGTLTELERTRSGVFTIADSLSLDEIRAKVVVRELFESCIEQRLRDTFCLLFTTGRRDSASTD